jgi:hypothetical protein
MDDHLVGDLMALQQFLTESHIVTRLTNKRHRFKDGARRYLEIKFTKSLLRHFQKNSKLLISVLMGVPTVRQL